MLFSRYFQYIQLEYEKLLKIWKSKTAATSDVIYIVVVAMESL